MATVQLVHIYKGLADRPDVPSRQMEYVIGRIEKELVKRARYARKVVGRLFQ